MTEEQTPAPKFNWLAVADELFAIKRLADAGVMACDSLSDTGERDPLAQIFDVIGDQIERVSEKILEAHR